MTQIKGPLDVVDCRARASKLRAEAARETAPERREALVTMAREYDALADEIEKLDT